MKLLREFFGTVKTHHILYQILKQRNPIRRTVDMQKLMEQEYDHLVTLHHRKLISFWQLKQIELESKGGQCHKCNKPWVPRTVKNLFCTFKYFEPDCLCYPVCPFCGCLLMREIEEGIDYCTNCKHYELCRETVEVEHKSDSGRTYKKKAKCRGNMLLSREGYICERCGHKVSGYMLSDDLLVPVAYRGGENG